MTPDTPDIRFAMARIKEIKPIEGPGVFGLLIVLFLILMSGAVVILGPSSNGGNTTPTPTPTTTPERNPRVYTVTYKSGFFSPTNLRIHAGDTVRFRNDHYLGITITSDLPGFDSVGDIPAGGNFAFTFAEVGIFSYYNEKNNNEVGTIIVR